ncbi:MAG: PTS sugar transporter subunit IIA [Spirochaetes bacterium]|nr:PTS sugar transporter subunit IIA [Spirochaetota bacterium]
MPVGAIETTLVILVASFVAHLASYYRFAGTTLPDGDSDGIMVPLIAFAVAGSAAGFAFLGFRQDSASASAVGLAAACFVLFSAGIETASTQGERSPLSRTFVRLAVWTAIAAAHAWIGRGGIQDILRHAAGIMLVLAAARLPDSGKPRLVGVIWVAVAVLAAGFFAPQNPAFPELSLPVRIALCAGLVLVLGLLRILLRTLRQETSISFAVALAGFATGTAAASTAGLFPAVGAFLAGLALGPAISPRGRLSDRLRSVSGGLAVPFVAAACGFMFIAVPKDPVSLDLAPVALASFLVALARGLPYRSGKGLGTIVTPNAFGWSAAGFAAAATAQSAGLLPPGTLVGLAVGAFAASIALRLIAWRTQAAASEDGPAISNRQQRRVLVALANPDTVASLLDAAGRLRTRPTDVVSPLCVVSGTQAADRDLDRAETSLARAMALSFTLGVEMMPSIRSAAVTADGLVSAVGEPGVACSVFGWNKPPRLTGAFGGVTDRVIGESSGFIVLIKHSERFSAYGTLFMVLPPFLVSHIGFEAGMKAVLAFADSIRARLVVATTTGSAEAARSALKRFGKTARIVEVPSWKELARTARETCGPRPAFIILSSRPAGTLWHPGLEHMLVDVSENFPESPIMAAYLPETSEAFPEAAPAAAAPRFEDMAAKARVEGLISVNMAETSVVDAVASIFEAAFPDDRRLASRLSARFSSVARERPIELEAGVVLLHARVEGFDEPVFLFGARPAGWHLIAIDSPVRILVILCTPIQADPSVHLDALAAIAREFGERKLASRLLAAKTPDEV